MMKKSIIRKHKGIKLFYQLTDGVIGKDYYKDHLVRRLPGIIRKLYLAQRRPLAVLDIATGHGYTPILLAKCYSDVVQKIVAYDINPRAVNLAKENEQLNGLHGQIDYRVGTLYQPLRREERFDLIVSALPPIPISASKLQRLPEDVRAHHCLTSTGGRSGRVLIDAMIEEASTYLNSGGAILTTHADFLGCDTTLQRITNAGLSGKIVGSLTSRKLKDTRLTMMCRDSIEKLGYTFSRDADGEEQFFVAVFFGQKGG